MLYEKAENLAQKVGFSHWGRFDVKDLRFLPEVRAACEANKCGFFNKSWACPPACGALDKCREEAGKFDWGILLQTTGEMEDDFDVEVMFSAEKLQKERFGAYCNALEGERPFLPLGAGTCTTCAQCTYPENPCRFPEKLRPSMEAFGLLVTDVCKAADIPYYYGPRTITYTCCVLFQNES